MKSRIKAGGRLPELSKPVVVVNVRCLTDDADSIYTTIVKPTHFESIREAAQWALYHINDDDQGVVSVVISVVGGEARRYDPYNLDHMTALELMTTPQPKI